MKSESIKNLAEALSKAQSEFKAVPLNAKNDFIGNKYADLGAVIEAVKPAMTANNLSVSQFPVSDNGKIGVNTILMHSSGEWLEEAIYIEMVPEKGKQTAQVVGSIISYLRRYALAAIFGIYSDEDNDGNQTPTTKTTNRPASVSRPATNVSQPAAAEQVVTTDSKGKLFADMTIPELSGHLNSYAKRLKENPSDEETIGKMAEAKMALEAKRANK